MSDQKTIDSGNGEPAKKSLSSRIETDDANDLADKIASLVQERGWNMEEFSRISRLNRHTVRQIMLEGGKRRLRNATVSACAKALGVTVNDLRTLPMDRLLIRMGQQAQEVMRQSEGLRLLYEKAYQPELLAWMERNTIRARSLSQEEIEEILSLQGDTGPLALFGVDGFVERLERRRGLIEKIKKISGTEYLDLVEKVVDLVHEKIQQGRPAQT